MKRKIIIFSDGSTSFIGTKQKSSIFTTKKKIVKRDLISCTNNKKHKTSISKSSQTLTRYKKKYVRQTSWGMAKW